MTGTKLCRAGRARRCHLRKLTCEPWLLACQPPEQRLTLEAYDASEAGRRHRNVVLRPAEDGSLVHVQHVRDLPSCKERRQWIGAHAAPVHFAASLSGRAAAPSPRPLLDSKRVSLGLEVPPNAVLAPIFLATSVDTGLSLGPNQCCHLLEGLDREHGAHLSVARLVAPHARDRPELGEQAGPVAGDGELCAIEPFDLPVAAGDDGESFGVGLILRSLGCSRYGSFHEPVGNVTRESATHAFNGRANGVPPSFQDASPIRKSSEHRARPSGFRGPRRERRTVRTDAKCFAVRQLAAGLRHDHEDARARGDVIARVMSRAWPTPRRGGRAAPTTLQGHEDRPAPPRNPAALPQLAAARFVA